MPYGFRGGDRYAPPDRASAVRLIHRALDLGINILDTAPVYGESEAIIGEALRGVRERPFIATKVNIAGANAAAAFRGSIEKSLRQLGADTLDLLQIHYATVDILRREDVLRHVEDAVSSGKIRFAGTSVYFAEEARIALAQPFYRTLQVPLSFLDRSMMPEMIPQAHAAGVGLLARSAFLRGALIDYPTDLPEKLQPLRQAAVRAVAIAGDKVRGCAELALRFCLSVSGISTVLIGVRSMAELEMNAAAAALGPLDDETMRLVSTVGVDDETLLSPVNWTGLI
jgi:aryl-alcohol dehydrogenase-like predicted oxidoreductase